MKPRFIFIVGVSRSGTSLMRRILNTSDQIAIANENHFMGHLLPSLGVRYRFRKFGDLRDDTNVRSLVDYIYLGGLERELNRLGQMDAHWHWIIDKVDRDEFMQRILESDRSERALFMVVMQVYADHRNKPIMGEKTPAHLRYVPKLLEWFPDAKVIGMIRDPRAVFVSELRRRRQLPVAFPYRQLRRAGFLFELLVALQTTLACLEGVHLHRKYAQQFPDQVYPLRFEDLVDDPEPNVRQVCEFVGVEFQTKMLDQRVVSRGFSYRQPGFDRLASSRWREQIPPWANAWFLFWFRKDLPALGYAG